MDKLPVLPVGMQSFTKLQKNNAVYVDKTRQLCHLIRYAPIFSFVGRPRRFGKSMTLSTLREMFSGNKKLFTETWAYDNYDFTPHQVLYIDFADVVTRSGVFVEQFVKYMRELAQDHEVDVSDATDAAEILRIILRTLGKKSSVVVLIDEYDRPLVDRISNAAEFDVVAEALRDFYVKLKSGTDYIHRCVMTGITEFGKLSIFSGANQFVNISFDVEYATLFGYTRPEIEKNFAAHIEHAQQITGLDADAWWEQLRYWYNGYTWNIDDVDNEDTRVYCPFTVTNYFRKPKRFINYWSQSGASNLLVEVMKTAKIDTLDFEDEEVTINQIMTLNPHDINIPGLLFQTGYLTLTGHVPLNPNALIVGYPNREISTTINQLQLAYASNETNAAYATKLVAIVRAENWAELVRVINQIMAGISYEIFHKHEHYAHVIFHTILAASELEVSSQVHTNTGRIDTLITYTTADGTPKHAIIELKTSATAGTTEDDLRSDRQLAQAALDQIWANNYTTGYTNPTAIGIVINTTTKQITAWTTDSRIAHKSPA